MNLETLDDYLTRTGPMLGPWEGEETARRALAAQGTSIVLPTLHRSRDKLKSFGQSLDHFLAGRAAEVGIALTFQRATDLLSDVIDASEESRRAVSDLLVLALRPEEDAGVRALATVFCGLKGVVRDVVVLEVARVFALDEDLLVKTAAAAVLHAMDEAPTELRTIADQVLADVVKNVQPEIFERFSEPGSPQARIASGIFAGIVIQMVPKFIAELDSQSPSTTTPSSSDSPASGASAEPTEGTSDPGALGERMRQAETERLLTDDLRRRMAGMIRALASAAPQLKYREVLAAKMFGSVWSLVFVSDVPNGMSILTSRPVVDAIRPFALASSGDIMPAVANESEREHWIKNEGAVKVS